jgi:hypothetical protein
MTDTISNNDAAKLLRCATSNVCRWLAGRCEPSTPGARGLRWPRDVVEIVAAERERERANSVNRDRSYLLDSIPDCTDEEACASTRRQDTGADDRRRRREEIRRQIESAPVAVSDIDYLATRAGERRAKGTVGTTSTIFARAKWEQSK